jgi:pyrimidine-nucleoside phosphorylase
LLFNNAISIGKEMAHYSMYDIIDRKKRGEKLSKEEYHWVIKSMMDKTVHDYQISAFLMACFLNELDIEETAYLTDAMLYSGDTLHFEGENVVDKHSTGGIGDKASFILAPIASACGVKVPMIAGRGLGFTGGTVDKIESVPGFRTDIGLKEFQDLLNKNGQVLIGQTKEIAPADKMIYALRDVTATIDSIPLITASIMSKKLAEGANGIVMDIKLGSGAFMRKKSDAKKLAKSIIRTAKRFDRKAVALITNMDQPLGNCVGNSIEIIESIKTLKNEGPKDLTEISLALAANMVHIAGIESTYAKALKRCKDVLKSGEAYKEFERLIEAQGGDLSYIRNPEKLEMAKTVTEVKAKVPGYIKSFQNDEIGLLLTEIGGGRKTKEDKIDFGVAFEFEKKIGDKVKVGDTIMKIYHHDHQKETVNYIEDKFLSEVVKISKAKVAKPMTIYDKVE